MSRWRSGLTPVSRLGTAATSDAEFNSSVGAGMGSNPIRDHILLIHPEADFGLCFFVFIVI